MKEAACVRGVLGVDAEDISDVELNELISDLKRRQRERQRLNDGMDAAEAINLEATGLAADIELAEKLKRRGRAARRRRNS